MKVWRNCYKIDAFGKFLYPVVTQLLSIVLRHAQLSPKSLAIGRPPSILTKRALRCRVEHMYKMGTTHLV